MASVPSRTHQSNRATGPCCVLPVVSKGSSESPRAVKFFNDSYFAWGCFRIFVLGRDGERIGRKRIDERS
jgi:hypothetical protein